MSFVEVILEQFGQEIVISVADPSSSSFFTILYMQRLLG